MTKKTTGKPDDGLIPKGEADSLQIAQRDEETSGRTLARATLNPLARHAVLAGSFANQVFGDGQRPSIMENAAVLGEEVAKVTEGDLTIASRILASQAVSLDALFTEMARRSGLNMGEYPQAMERYMRLALKAQSACRATLEALAKLHQPREQTVKHVHVNQGGQAVVTDQFHHHAGGHRNAESAEQPHAAGTSAAGTSPAMLGHDTQSNGMQSPSHQRGEAMPDARRQGQRRT